MRSTSLALGGAGVRGVLPSTVGAELLDALAGALLPGALADAELLSALVGALLRNTPVIAPGPVAPYRAAGALLVEADDVGCPEGGCLEAGSVAASPGTGLRETCAGPPPSSQCFSP